MHMTYPESAIVTATELPNVEQGRVAAKLVISIEAIDVPPQVRKSFDSEFIGRMADAIRSKGQTWPVQVRQGRALGRYDLVAGQQRLRGCKLAGKTEVWAIEVEGDLTEADILEEQLQENGLRMPLRPCEEAEALDRLRHQRGWSSIDLARQVKLNSTHVSRRLALLRYLPHQRARIDAEDIPETVASEIAKVVKEPERTALFERAVQEQWTKERAIAEVSTLTKRRKPKATQSVRPLKRVSLRLGERGATVAVHCPDEVPELNTQEVVYVLEFALKEVRKALKQNIQAGALAAHFQKLRPVPLATPAVNVLAATDGSAVLSNRQP